MIEPSSYNTATKTIIYYETSSQTYSSDSFTFNRKLQFRRKFSLDEEKSCHIIPLEMCSNFFPADFSSHSGDDITPVNQGKLPRDENTC